MTRTNINPNSLYHIGGVSALLHLAAILASIVIAVALGPRPNSAAELFAAQLSNPLAALLRGDFVLIFLLLGACWARSRRCSGTCAKSTHFRRLLPRCSRPLPSF